MLGLDLDNLLALILGAGGAAFASVLFKFILALREQAEGREAVAIRNLEKWRDDADARAERCLDALDLQRAQTSYWQHYCGVLAYALGSAGVPIPTPPAPPDAPPPTNEPVE